MVRKEGKIPVNARVDVDYTGKKPKIKFGYTGKDTKKDAVKQNLIGRHSYIIVGILFFLLFTLIISNENYVSQPKDCEIDFDDYSYNLTTTSIGTENGEEYFTSYNNSYKAIYGFNLTCDGETEYYRFNSHENKLNSNHPHFYHSPGAIKSLTNILPQILTIIIFFLAFWILNRWTTKYLVKQRWYQKWLPEHMAGKPNKKKKYYKFKPKDVEENVVIIPNFKNVELDYKTNGDFDKYLKRIQIKEYRHNEYKKQKVGKLKVDNYKWYAVFYFSDKPKNGFLEVIFQ